MADCLWHFSEDPGITQFIPRPVRRPAPRADGFDWLNGPLVWAIDEPHAPLYFFPRDCPRILIWAAPDSRAQDLAAHGLGPRHRMIAYIEPPWSALLNTAQIWRYELPGATFEPLHDAGMYVSRAPVTPRGCTALEDLPARLLASGVALRVVPRLRALGNLWTTSLKVSGIRLRNAASDS